MTQQTAGAGGASVVAPGAMALVTHPIDAQRDAIAQALASLGFTPHPMRSPQEVAQLNPPLGSLWVVFDQGELTAQLCAHLNARQQRPFWGVVALGQGGEVERARLMEAGAEAYLPYPFSRDELLKLASTVARERAPVSVWGVLPAQLATAIDKAWMRLDEVDYYALLELTPESSKTELEQRFHQRSLVLHPDRHRPLKDSHPHIYSKVNELYKRLLEAYRALSEPSKRQMYDMLRARGAKRWDEALAASLSEVSARAESPQGRAALLEAERLKLQGRWAEAARCVQYALSLEPERAPLRELDDCYAHILKLIAREPHLAQQPTGAPL